MAGFVWGRAHTIVAVSAAVVLVGVGSAVALTGQGDGSGAVAPPLTSASASAAPSSSPPPGTAATPRPPAVDPLTGKKPSAAGVLAVKVENIAAARPQVGLGSADIVFVEEVEGSLTRLVAVYHSRFPSRLGPVRSARSTDVVLLPLFGTPGLVYSGANRKVQRSIDRASIRALPRSDRDGSRVAPHNVFVDLDAIAAEAELRPARTIGWTFAAADPRWAAAPKDGDVSGRVGGDRFTFAPAGGRYVVRWNGQPYADGDSGTKATTDNVVMMSVKNAPDGNADVNGARSVRSDTTGRGTVVIYRDGRRLTGTWQRSAPSKPLRFLDGDGRDLPLAPGRTWVLLRG
ncbi:DUF3048 domain-containing protein [Microlunatus aurantiacus]|uniref:DUF3048 domain-containing protein n=1 Tax=Microlunatus aurantiacus TaxID=446786 RepID=UPI0031DF579D